MEEREGESKSQQTRSRERMTRGSGMRALSPLLLLLLVKERIGNLPSLSLSLLPFKHGTRDEGKERKWENERRRFPVCEHTGCVAARSLSHSRAPASLGVSSCASHHQQRRQQQRQRQQRQATRQREREHACQDSVSARLRLHRQQLERDAGSRRADRQRVERVKSKERERERSQSRKAWKMC